MVGASARGCRVRVLAAAFALPTALLVGCGSEEEPSGAAADAVVPAASSDAASATPAAQSPEPEVGSLTMFRMPSGNIGCAIRAGGVDCDVAGPTFAPPPRPTSCEGDWGQSVTLDAKRARFVCATDTPFDPESPVLAYGTQTRAKGYVCSSSREGLRCEHTGGGHGFTLSRSSYRLF